MVHQNNKLILSFSFGKAVQVLSLKITAPQDKGPKTIKLFKNQPQIFTRDMAQTNQAIQEFDMLPHSQYP
jgi:hypothetical protein